MVKDDFLSIRLRDYFKNARERTDIYEKKRNRYFQINLTLASALATMLTFFLSFFNNPENLIYFKFFLIIIMGAVASILIILIGLIYEFLEKKTDFGDFDRQTLRFYKGNVPEDNKPDNLKDKFKVFKSNFEDDDGNLIKNEKNFIDYDIKDLYILHYYASHYHKLAKNFREILLIEIIIILGSIIAQLYYSVFLIFSLEIFIVTIIISCIIIIFGVRFYYDIFKELKEFINYDIYEELKKELQNKT